MDRLSGTLSSVLVKLSEFEKKVEAVDTAVNQTKTAISHEVQTLQRTTEELSGDVSALRGKVEALHCEAENATCHTTEVLLNTTTSIFNKQMDLDSKLRSMYLNSIPSCRQLAKDYPSAPSGYYWTRNRTGQPTKVYCDMERHRCNSTGGWMRVAHVDMAGDIARQSNMAAPPFSSPAMEKSTAECVEGSEPTSTTTHLRFTLTRK